MKASSSGATRLSESSLFSGVAILQPHSPTEIRTPTHDDNFSGEVETSDQQAPGLVEQPEGFGEVEKVFSGSLQGGFLVARNASSRREGYSGSRMDGARLAQKLHRQSSIKSSSSFFSALSGGSVSRPIADARTRSLQQVMKELKNLKTSKSFSCCGQQRYKSQGYWIRSGCANYLFGFVIIVNAAYIGFETDANRPSAEVTLPKKFWTIVESCFLSIFVFELALRFRADCCDVFRDFWGFFDTIIVVIGVIDTCVFQFIFEEDTAEDLQTLSLFRLGRLVRIARVLRILRLLRFVRELLLLVKGLLGALKALIWAFLLIMMVLFISAIFVTEIIRIELDDLNSQDAEEISLWFGDVGRTVLTLSQIMTLEGWPRIVRVVCLDGSRPWLLFFFFPFLCCTNFALLNVVTAVMVEKVFEFAEDEKTNEVKSLNRSRRQAIQKVCKLFTDIDGDGNGSLSAAEMKSALQDPVAMRQFQELAIAKHDIDTLFQCLDIDGNGELSIEEFIEGCLRMHGSATSSDLLRVHYDVHRTRKSLKITKLTRHMMWSAWCLNDDYQKKKAPAMQAHRNKLRSKTGPAMARSSTRHSEVSLKPKPLAPVDALMANCAKTDPTTSRTSNESAQSQKSQKGAAAERSSSAKRLSISAIPAAIQQSFNTLSGLVKKDRLSIGGPRRTGSSGDVKRVASEIEQPRRVSETDTASAKAKMAHSNKKNRHCTAEQPHARAESDPDLMSAATLDAENLARDRRAAKTDAKKRALAQDSAGRASARSSTAAANIAGAGEKEPRQMQQKDLLLPLETTDLLEEVVAEQRQMRDLIEVLGNEVRLIRGQVKQWQKEPKAGYDADVLLVSKSSSQPPPSNFADAHAAASLREPRRCHTAGAGVGASIGGSLARDVD